MKITLCGSIAFLDKMSHAKQELEEHGHAILIPHIDPESELTNEYKAEVMKAHFTRIKNSDAILVLNYEKKGIAGYIGANTLIEMGVAFALEKKIFLLNEIPDISYRDEIEGMMPILIHNDLKKII